MQLKKYSSVTIGLTLHYVSGLPTRDVTNWDKMFSRRVIESVKIESTGGFEVPMELTVKAYAMGFKIAEIPTVQRDREKGKSQFRLMKFAPNYARWYFYGLTHRP